MTHCIADVGLPPAKPKKKAKITFDTTEEKIVLAAAYGGKALESLERSFPRADFVVPACPPLLAYGKANKYGVVVDTNLNRFYRPGGYVWVIVEEITEDGLAAAAERQQVRATGGKKRIVVNNGRNFMVSIVPGRILKFRKIEDGGSRQATEMLIQWTESAAMIDAYGQQLANYGEHLHLFYLP